MNISISNWGWVLVSLTFFVACNISQKAHQPVSSDKNVKQHFGEKISEKNQVPLEGLFVKIGTSDTTAAKITATVDNVCQVKGCWMNVHGENQDEKVFVTFKDYGFFMPKDISGKKVTMEGIAFKEITPVETLRHYAEDEGKSKEEIEAITTPEETLRFEANGVIVYSEE